MSLKSEIAPKGLNFKPTEFMIGDKYACIMTVVSYPKYIDYGYLSNLSNISGVKIVVKHIPIEFSTLQKMLNKEIADLKMRYQTLSLNISHYHQATSTPLKRIHDINLLVLTC